MKDLLKIFEKRRNDLARTLEEDSHQISLERQHQIYGAILEIDVFLRTLEFYSKQKDLENSMQKKQNNQTIILN